MMNLMMHGNVRARKLVVNSIAVFSCAYFVLGCGAGREPNSSAQSSETSKQASRPGPLTQPQAPQTSSAGPVFSGTVVDGDYAALLTDIVNNEGNVLSEKIADPE